MSESPDTPDAGEAADASAARLLCSHCSSPMKQGFVMGKTRGGPEVTRWSPGPPQRSFWTTIKQPPDSLPIGAFRCTACGRLEFFADKIFELRQRTARRHSPCLLPLSVLDDLDPHPALRATDLVMGLPQDVTDLVAFVQLAGKNVLGGQNSRNPTTSRPLGADGIAPDTRQFHDIAQHPASADCPCKRRAALVQTREAGSVTSRSGHQVPTVERRRNAVSFGPCQRHQSNWTSLPQSMERRQRPRTPSHSPSARGG